MSRQAIYKQIKEHFGLVPVMFKALSDTSLEHEWRLFRELHIAEGPIPARYRELIGLAVAAASRCRYSTSLHTEMARLTGAGEAELEEAIQLARSSAGWSTYLNGLQCNFEQFKSDVIKYCEYKASLPAGALAGNRK